MNQWVILKYMEKLEFEGYNNDGYNWLFKQNKMVA